MRSFFVTGTDTEIGKTYVSAALLRALTARGQTVAPMKPVASGAITTPDGLRSEDALALLDAAGGNWSYGAVNPYCFEPPIAPHVAAAEAGVEITIDRIQSAFEMLSAQADRVIVEGVGGWCVPLGDDLELGDVVRALDLPVVVVVGLRLGCLNHALLTVRQLLADGMTVAGWVANAVDPAMDLREDNIAALSERIPVPRIGYLPHGVEELHLEAVL
ncbi:MAG: dethiobiotin synthase [Pseudomonadota bacterium]